MCDNAVAKKSVRCALTGSVKELGRQNNVTRCVFFLQTSNRGYANDPPNVQGTERINVGSMVQFVWKQPVATTVSRQEVNLSSMHVPGDDNVGGIAEWSFHPLFSRLFDPVHLIKTASAYDADCRDRVLHSLGD